MLIPKIVHSNVSIKRLGLKTHLEAISYVKTSKEAKRMLEKEAIGTGSPNASCVPNALGAG